MEMPVRVIKNAIRCAYCGAEIESVRGWDFQSHTCEELQRVRGAKAKIAVDGGRELIGRRVLGYPSDWVNAAVYDPPEDPAEAAGDS